MNAGGAGGVGAHDRPRLARGVRLRQDRITGRHLLLRPERGFELRGSALEVIRLCDGARSVEGIVAELAAAHAAQPPAQISDDVVRLLGELADRGLIEIEAA